MLAKLIPPALILGFCFMFYFSALGAVPFYDKGEPREGTVVQAMTETGNWILPLRNAQFIPSKPPLFHWLAAAVSWATGQINEVTVRFPSALLGAAGVFLVYLAGAYFWSPAVGFFAALVLATSFEWWLTATIARVDMTLNFILLCFFLFFYTTYRAGGGRGKAIGLGVIVGLAVLAKGPLGGVIPCLTILLFLFCQRDMAFIRKRHPVTMFIAAALVAGSWYLLAYWEGGESFLRRLFHENIDAALGEGGGHRQSFFYFVPVLFSHMAPWSLFLPAVAAFLYRSRKQLAQQGLLYPLVWFAVVFMFFSVAAGKRPVYILPLYPAVALVFGVWYRNLVAQDRLARNPLTRLGGYLAGAAFLLFSALVLVHLAGIDLVEHTGIFLKSRDRAALATYGRLLADQRPALWSWSVISAVGGIALLAAMKKSAWNVVFGSIDLVTATSFYLLQSVFHPTIAAAQTFKPFMERVVRTVRDAPLYFCRAFDNGAIFYAGRSIPQFEIDAASRSGPFYLLVWENEWKGLARKGLVVLDTSGAKDTDEGRRLMLVAVRDVTQVDGGLAFCETSETASSMLQTRPKG